MKISKEHLIILDSTGHFLFTIYLPSRNLDIHIGNDVFSISEARALFQNPSLNIGKFIYYPSSKSSPSNAYTFKYKSKVPMTPKRISRDDEADVDYIAADPLNDSKNTLSFMMSQAGQPEEQVYILASGVRYFDNDNFYIDVHDPSTASNLMVGVVVPRLDALGVLSNVIMEPNIIIADDLTAKPLGENDTIYQTGTVTIKSTKKIKQKNKEPDKTSKVSAMTKMNQTFTAAWKLSGEIADKEIPGATYDPKQFLKNLQDSFTQAVGYDKTNTQSNMAGPSFSLTNQFYTQEEVEIILDRYKVYHNKNSLLDDKGSGIYVNPDVVSLRNGEHAVTISKDGLELSHVTSASASDRKATGILPIPTESNPIVDILPASNLFLSMPRRIPDIKWVMEVFGYLNAFTMMTIDIVHLITDSERLSKEFKERLDAEIAEFKELQNALTVLDEANKNPGGLP